ncbi:MAG: hypothetical protein Q7T45_09505 [Bradyrhizobium sp.]|nr:hypothetical protein [Bradyrhizobium sp.]MDO8398043.1 hypothetical protein [Bradyrhizobium sp.]
MVIAATVAAISTAAFLIFEFGPWNRQALEPSNQAATKAAAQAAGAKVIPTQPKLVVEPTPPGPRPVQPPVVVN